MIDSANGHHICMVKGGGPFFEEDSESGRRANASGVIDERKCRELSFASKNKSERKQCTTKKERC